MNKLHPENNKCSFKNENKKALRMKKKGEKVLSRRSQGSAKWRRKERVRDLLNLIRVQIAKMS
jgi:hypothetical protein